MTGDQTPGTTLKVAITKADGSRKPPTLPRQNPEPMALTGAGLTIEEFVCVARKGVPVIFGKKVETAVVRCRRVLEAQLDRGELIYGVNTGFGGNVRYAIASSDIELHQQNLLRFLCCGVGTPFPVDVTRGAMVLRANALANGFSAIRLSTLRALCRLIEHGITPIIPRYGSVGASGDLIPSAYIARTLVGDGRVTYLGREMNAAEALCTAGVAPVRLAAKEGLALVNGTSVMTAIAALVIYDTEFLAWTSVAAVAMAIEALLSTASPFEEMIQQLKHHPGQLRVAETLRRFLAGSSLTVEVDDIRDQLRQRRSQSPMTRANGNRSLRADDFGPKLEESIQPPYSLRCAPQGLGPIVEALEHARQTVEREMNSVNDNPLINPNTGEVYHTGNFYGGHIARAMDGIKLDLATIANWLHAIVAMVVDPRFNTGLPANLALAPGVNSGFKGMQLCLTSLVTAIRQMAAPSALHTLPTEQYNQDIVSLGLHSAATALDVVDLVANASAISLLVLSQALDLRIREMASGSVRPRLGKMTAHLHGEIRNRVKFVERDRPLDDDIREVRQMLRDQSFPVLTDTMRGSQ